VKSTIAAGRTALLLGGAALAAALATAHAAPPTVNTAINDHQTVELAGNTRPEATLANDRGMVADSLVLDHMQLLLKRPAETEAALVAHIDALHDPASPEFHNWMSAAELGVKYGPAASDVAAVASWLGSHGFEVSSIPAGRMMIDFSGTAAQVREAFHTEIHQISADGVTHIANMSNPRIPAALSGVIAGIVSLTDFRPHTNFHARPAYTFTNSNGTFQTVVPADLATIYNINPLFSAGISGQGQTIVVIEDTNVYSTADWTTFRSTFGLSGYTAGSFTQVHPTGSSACSNPGTVAGNEEEATLDAEWASAAAPSAKIELASCKDSLTTFGGLVALQNLLNGSSPPAVVSISYGECETANGATANAAYTTTYQQAVAEGVSVFVSSGDAGGASCDQNKAKATHGIGVSGFASTAYNVAVGGTDFGDTVAGTNNTYWNTSNTSAYGSAKSYIPEIPWNDSCASVLIANFEGYPTTYGAAGFCNSTAGKPFLSTAGGSGGPSACATGKPSTKDVVGGTCKGIAKPSWQVIVGNPADGVRDIPDVSLFAANGVWGHYYLFCDTDSRDGAVCSGSPSTWSGAGGTSFASPIVAGIQALVNQKQGARQGNPNPTYYRLAAAEYGAGGSSICNSSKGNAAATSCTFYDVTTGDMDVNCTGAHNCYLPSGTNGVLSTSTTSYLPAYGTNVGWDFSTGIGTLNAANLANNW
jgi:subtilase family serine protease